MGNVTSSIYGAFFLLLMRISEKFQNKNQQENMNLNDNTKENLIDGNSNIAYKNVDIEKNNKAENDKKSKSNFNFFEKNKENNQKDPEKNTMKYQLLKNSEYDFETNDTNKKEEDKQNYEILKQEIKQSHIEFDEELNINNDNKRTENFNTEVFFKDNCNKEQLISVNSEKQEDKEIEENSNINQTKNSSRKINADNKKAYIEGGDKESFDDLRKQILENKFDEDDF